MSAASTPPDTADLTLQQLRGLRRENAALIEQNNRLFEHMIRLQQSMIALQAEVQGVRSDILLLENHNASRHGEVLAIVRRMDEAGVPGVEV